VEGRSPAGRLIRDIRQLCTAYFAEGRPTEFLAGTAVGLSEDGACGQNDSRVLSVWEFILGNPGDPDTWRGESFAVR